MPSEAPIPLPRQNGQPQLLADRDTVDPVFVSFRRAGAALTPWAAVLLSETEAVKAEDVVLVDSTVVVLASG